jgi:hypothetical protein
VLFDEPNLNRKDEERNDGDQQQQDDERTMADNTFGRRK